MADDTGVHPENKKEDLSKLFKSRSCRGIAAACWHFEQGRTQMCASLKRWLLPGVFCIILNKIIKTNNNAKTKHVALGCQTPDSSHLFQQDIYAPSPCQCTKISTSVIFFQTEAWLHEYEKDFSAQMRKATSRPTSLRLSTTAVPIVPTRNKR